MFKHDVTPFSSYKILHVSADCHVETASTPANPELEQARPHSAGEEEIQLQLALAMSKEEAENDAKKKTNDDLKLQMALEESKKVEATPQVATNDEVKWVLVSS